MKFYELLKGKKGKARKKKSSNIMKYKKNENLVI